MKFRLKKIASGASVRSAPASQFVKRPKQKQGPIAVSPHPQAAAKSHHDNMHSSTSRRGHSHGHGKTEDNGTSITTATATTADINSSQDFSDIYFWNSPKLFFT